MLHLLVLFLIPGLFGNAEGHFRRVCDNSQITIYCGSKEIDIRSASYGRTRRGVCGGPDHNTWCHAGSSMMVVRNKCQGQTSCTLHAVNTAFGDPCIGTRKYLEVTYNCVPRTGCYGKLLEICHGHSQVIHCHGKRIDIISANYGRLFGGPTCGGPTQVRNADCGAARVLDKVRRDCQGRYFCVLQALHTKYGDPCFGTQKYLEVRYKCY